MRSRIDDVQFQDQKQEGISGTISSGFTLLELLVVSVTRERKS